MARDSRVMAAANDTFKKPSHQTRAGQEWRLPVDKLLEMPHSKTAMHRLLIRGDDAESDLTPLAWRECSPWMTANQTASIDRDPRRQSWWYGVPREASDSHQVMPRRVPGSQHASQGKK